MSNATASGCEYSACPVNSGVYLVNGTCAPCPPGNTCSGSTSAPSPCTGGTVPDANARNCITPATTCIAGQWLNAGVCSVCPTTPVRMVCAGGTAGPANCTGVQVPDSSQTTCVAPATSCPPGQYLTNGVCNSCTNNMYCSGGTAQPASCASGFLVNSTYSGCIAVATSCPAGQYLYYGRCLGCSYGNVCYGNTTAPQSCPSGLFPSTNQTVCVPALTSCNPGYYLLGGQCISCWGGYACPGGSGMPQYCAYGSYPNFTACMPPPSCTPGTYAPMGSSTCMQCPYNMVCAGGSAGQTTCFGGQVPNMSPGGSYCVAAVSCSQGMYNNGGVCAACPANMACSGGTQSPYTCPTGMVPLTPIPYSCTYPVVSTCPANQFLSGGMCSPCMANYTCAGGTAPAQFAGTAPNCAAGTYAQALSSSTATCLACDGIYAPANAICPGGSAFFVMCPSGNAPLGASPTLASCTASASLSMLSGSLAAPGPSSCTLGVGAISPADGIAIDLGFVNATFSLERLTVFINGSLELRSTPGAHVPGGCSSLTCSILANVDSVVSFYPSGSSTAAWTSPAGFFSRIQLNPFGGANSLTIQLPSLYFAPGTRYTMVIRLPNGPSYYPCTSTVPIGTGVPSGSGSVVYGTAVATGGSSTPIWLTGLPSFNVMVQLNGARMPSSLCKPQFTRLVYSPNGLSLTCVGTSSSYCTQVCGGAPPAASSSSTPTPSGTPTPSQTPSPSSSPAPLDAQTVLMPYAIHSAELCNASAVAEKVLSPSDGFGVQLRATFASSLGYNASATFITGIIDCGGVSIPVARDALVNELDPSQLNVTSLVRRRLSASSGVLRLSRALYESLSQLQLSVDGATIIIELGVDVPVAIAGPLANFLSAVLSGANATVLAASTAALQAALADPSLSGSGYVLPATLQSVVASVANSSNAGVSQFSTSLLDVPTIALPRLLAAVGLPNTTNISTAPLVEAVRIGDISTYGRGIGNVRASSPGSSDGGSGNPGLGALVLIPVTFIACGWYFFCWRRRSDKKEGKAGVESKQNPVVFTASPSAAAASDAGSSGGSSIIGKSLLALRMHKVVVSVGDGEWSAAAGASSKKADKLSFDPIVTAGITTPDAVAAENHAVLPFEQVNPMMRQASAPAAAMSSPVAAADPTPAPGTAV